MTLTIVIKKNSNISSTLSMAFENSFNVFDRQNIHSTEYGITGEKKVS